MLGWSPEKSRPGHAATGGPDVGCLHEGTTMSDSAGNLPKPNPTADGERGALAPEDADRFASTFVPSWQFDEAPFTAGPMNPADLQELGAPSSNVNSDRTLVDKSPPSAAIAADAQASVAPATVTVASTATAPS